jgi:hypothetical protein
LSLHSTYVNGDAAAAAAGYSVLDAWTKEEEVRDEIDPEDSGWELDVVLTLYNRSRHFSIYIFIIMFAFTRTFGLFAFFNFTLFDLTTKK